MQYPNTWAVGILVLQLANKNSNLRGRLKKQYFETECILAVQHHPKSLISVQMESTYATWTSN